MNRAFVSLYLIIVLSIILLGLVLNKFWDEVHPPAAVDPYIVDLISVIEKSLQDNQPVNKKEKLQSLTSQLHYKVELLSILSFSKTGIAEKIKHGGIISVSDEHTRYFYKRLNNADDVLMISAPTEVDGEGDLYIGFILLFYSAIAGVVFLWVWPLTRDLNRLRLHTQKMGKDGEQPNITISTRSVLYPFAKTFNAMAKRLNEILRSQKEMTLAVSHELRTPLARMKFALAITEDQNIPILLQRQLLNINKDVLEMEALINSFLAYAGFDHQSETLSQREGHMRDLIKEIISRLVNHENKHIKIEVNDKTNGQVFICEWSLMQTAIQNLIHNALGYANTKIIVSMNFVSNHYLIEVEDDGPGVPDDQQSRIFESFVRVYSELTNRSGFGLGLALVKRVMEWHLGSVNYYRASLGGAKFILKWPQQKPPY